MHIVVDFHDWVKIWVHLGAWNSKEWQHVGDIDSEKRETIGKINLRIFRQHNEKLSTICQKQNTKSYISGVESDIKDFRCLDSVTIDIIHSMEDLVN